MQFATFLDILVSPQLIWFTGTLVFIMGILTIEIFMLIGGVSILGIGDTDIDCVDVDVDVDVDVANIDADIDIALNSPYGDSVDLVSPYGFFEIGRVPMVIWSLGMLTGYAATGFGIQFTLLVIGGFMLPQLSIGLISILPAILFGKCFAIVFSIVVPKTTSEAVWRNALGGSLGKITVGTAMTDLPAIAMVSDRFGNPHNIRVIPHDPSTTLPQGTQIIVLRGKGPIYDAISMDEATTRQLISYGEKT